MDFLTQTIGKLAYIDVAIIAVYMLICLYIGCKSVGRIKNIKDYTLGPSRISTAVLVATIYATHLGAGATISAIERISVIGILFAVTLFLSPINWWLGYLIFGRNIRQFKGCITLIDIMEHLYGRLGRIMTLLGSIMDNVATLAAQAIALGYLLHYFLDIPMGMGLFIGMGTIIFYSTLGGVRAVVLTDLFQFGIFYVVLPALCGLLLYEMGGWETVKSMIPAEKWSMNLDSSEKAYMFWGCVFYTIMPVHGAPFIQRFLMSMNPKQLKHSVAMVSIIDLTVTSIICIFGFILATGIAGDLTTGSVIWHLMDHKVMFILKGVALVGIIAIIMSTADSYLNVSGALIARNIVKFYFPNISDKSELITARMATFGTGVLAILLASYGSGILQMIWLSANFYGPIITIPLFAGFLKFRTNSKSFAVAVCCAFVGTLMGKYIQGSFDVLSLVFGLTGSATGLFGMHYLQKANGILHNVAPAAVVEAEPSVEPDIVKESIGIVFAIQAFLKEHLPSLKYLRFRNIALYSRVSVKKHPARYYEFAILGVILSIYPLAFPTFVYGMLPKVAEEAGALTSLWVMDMTLRVFTGFACLAIALQDRWQKINRKKYLPVYFHFMILCTLSILGTYSCLAFPGNQSFVIPGILAIFIMAIFLDRLTFTIISLTGFVLGNLLYLWVAWAGNQVISYKDTLGIQLLYLVLSLVTAWVLYFIKDRQAKLEMEVWHKIAITDKLTGLYNRHYFDMRLETTLEQAKSRERTLSMMIIDIDHFKRINDTYGHLAGDNVIQKVAEHMLKNIRPGDICARIGGEEFIILMPETSLKEAEALAERLRLEVASMIFDVPSSAYGCTISIGLSQALKIDTSDSLKRRADEALYKAKADGRNRIFSIVDPIERKPVNLNTSEAVS